MANIIMRLCLPILMMSGSAVVCFGAKVAKNSTESAKTDAPAAVMFGVVVLGGLLFIIVSQLHGVRSNFGFPSRRQ